METPPKRRDRRIKRLFPLAIPMNPVLLVNVPVGVPYLSMLEKRFDVIYAPGADTRAASTRHAEVELVLTNGSIGFSASQMEAMPRLRLLSALGVGYENIDVAHAKTRGIVVSNGAGTNAATVADHAFALLLGTIRRIPFHDKACRDGIWRDALPDFPGLAGKKIGIIGFGHIGEKLARRAVGFDCEVAYLTRRQREHVAYRYFADVLALATWSDVLIVAAPGGAETRHMVNAAVLQALGPTGFIVNIARGSLIDTDALASALREHRIAGAGLDVYESEPLPPASLLSFDNVVLSPHVAGSSPEAIHATISHFIDNAERHFNGEDVSTPL